MKENRWKRFTISAMKNRSKSITGSSPRPHLLRAVAASPKASGAIGGFLGICPLLNMDNEGRLIPRFKIRTKKKVIKKIVDQMEENAEGGSSYSGKCYISQSACYDDARAVADLIEERFPI